MESCRSGCRELQNLAYARPESMGASGFWDIPEPGSKRRRVKQDELNIEVAEIPSEGVSPLKKRKVAGVPQRRTKQVKGETAELAFVRAASKGSKSYKLSSTDAQQSRKRILTKGPHKCTVPTGMEPSELSAQWCPAEIDCEGGVSTFPSFPARPLYKHFDPLSRKLLEQIRIEAGVHGKAMQVKLSGIPHAGYGLFARVAFGRGSIICKYDGSIKLSELTSESHRSHCLSLKWCGYVLDGTPIANAVCAALQLPRKFMKSKVSSVSLEDSVCRKNEMRLADVGLGCLVNHKKRNCANVQFILVRTHVHDLYPPEVFLQALRDIHQGEELFACYGSFESKLWDKQN
eukprot:gnl/MRDRNA2_/MRDRNA2_115985_c0_seq1.p1 gnl/MRDRNA2_/MRDRNA2_115985_c0~~gnl/MRDRNA2_/MRDRNA2_115985_c0_seq1.p1  ORF type:complete len:346 (+),score=39.83 gnl/MRDRNA2_/MRDRNA2_115985_c0_seq1:149-1186(+)